MRQISEDVCSLVMEFKGSMSGEHGDGLARSYHNERLFGPTLYRAFQNVKAIFDPRNLLNPGKVVNAPAMTENLRYGVAYRAAQIRYALRFHARRGICPGRGNVQRHGDLPPG